MEFLQSTLKADLQLNPLRK